MVVLEEVDRCCLAKGEGEPRSFKGVLQGKVLATEKKEKRKLLGLRLGFVVGGVGLEVAEGAEKAWEG